MPYFATSQEWLDQSSLLLKARPSTTRISTKYSIKPPKKRRSVKATPNPASEAATTQDSTSNPATAPAPYKATLVLKTYDPVSGICLKYATDKAAEVGRLISSLGRLGRTMAGLPDLEDGTGAGDDVEMADAPPNGSGGAGASFGDKSGATAAGGGADGQQKGTAGHNAGTATGQTGGGGKKKKKGKK